jgi:DNA-directed RNA polymerase subunit RPC12/RpoP
MGEFDEIDGLLGPGDFHKDLQKEAASESAQRSAADDVIDAVGDLRPKNRTLVCPKCSGTSFIKRKPLGAGIATSICTSCKFKIQGQTTTNARLIACKGGPQRQASDGPYYHGRDPYVPADKNSPRHRRKGKSISAFNKDK